jgi:hypothetical protein
MGEELIQSSAEVVLPRIAVARLREAIFGTTAVAKRSDLATLALGS